MLPEVTRAALAKRGLAAAGIVQHWAEIVGPVLSAASVPERLVRDRSGDHATLVIKVRPGIALEMQHLEPLVVERINGHFGFRAVTRLRLVQGPLPAPPPQRPRRKPAAPADLARLDSVLAGVSDAELRERLKALGRSLLERKA